MELFTIEYEAPSFVYAPGQLVRGFVHIQLKEPMKARAVTLQTMGVAHTCWNCHEPHIIPTRRKNQTVYQRRVYGRQVYLDAKFTVWDGCNNDKMIPAGTNKFPFAFNMPMYCPPSFEGSVGYIRYYCKAKIDRPWKFDKTAIQAFTVIPNFDLNTISYASAPIMKVDSKNLGVLMFKHGRINAKVMLPKSGYVPGETIEATVEITNNATKEVEKIELFLTEVSRYEGKCTEVGAPEFCHMDHVSKTHNHRTVTKSGMTTHMPSNHTAEYKLKLSIPPIVPSFNICPIIQVDYKIEVKITAKGHMNNSLCVDLPVLIGTYPVRAPQYVIPMPQNASPPPEFLVPPQPTDAISGPPPAYADCVFGQGKVALDDEDGKGAEGGGFVPRYVYYNNQSSSQAPPLPDKTTMGATAPNVLYPPDQAYPSAYIPQGPDVSGPLYLPSNQTYPNASNKPYLASSIGSGVSVPYPNAPPSYGQSVVGRPGANYPSVQQPSISSPYNMSGLQSSLPPHPSQQASTSHVSSAPPMTPDEALPNLSSLSPNTHL